MPLTNQLYFAQVAAGVWADWVQVINVGDRDSKVFAVARDWTGRILWHSETVLRPYQGWVVPVEPASVTQDLSLVLNSEMPIAAERHCHLGTEVLAFPGASIEARTAGRRLFFPELVAGCGDWFIVFNINEQQAVATVYIRDDNGTLVNQFTSPVIPPMGGWVFNDQQTGNVQGTVEVISDQIIVSERHLHYQGTYHPNGVAVGQLGQVLD